MANQSPEMIAEFVTGLVYLFEHHDILIHIDGSWGVDALLSERTRKHTGWISPTSMLM